jgi:hypothetical protein
VVAELDTSIPYSLAFQGEQVFRRASEVHGIGIEKDTRGKVFECLIVVVEVARAELDTCMQ